MAEAAPAESLPEAAAALWGSKGGAAKQTLNRCSALGAQSQLSFVFPGARCGCSFKVMDPKHTVLEGEIWGQAAKQRGMCYTFLIKGFVSVPSGSHRSKALFQFVIRQ